MTELTDMFITELLHLSDLRGNRLLDIAGGGADKAYRLILPCGENGSAALDVIRARRGKASNKTTLAGSALACSTLYSPAAEKWTWSDLDGNADPKALDGFITDAYAALSQKGNNPLFLGVGALHWNVAAGDGIKNITSPLLIFPIRLVRGTVTGPVEIEFVDDDAYFNPCIIGKLRAEFPTDIPSGFPHPNGNGDFDAPIDIDKFVSAEYFSSVEKYVVSLRPDGDRSVEFDRNAVYIAQYNHSDICMYYDVRRNLDKIYAHPLVKRVFGMGGELAKQSVDGEIFPVLPTDSVQEKLLGEISAGKSLIVKGPPGTGKTVTIANVVATLLARGKRVLVASEKISALSEVYAKLPESLRQFVLLLDYETERAAAAVDPAKIRAELKRLVSARKTYSYDARNDARYAAACKKRADAAVTLSDYMSVMFDGRMSYYDTLDLYYKNGELPVVRFKDGIDADGFATEYDASRAEVKHAAEYIARYGLDDNPWTGVSAETDTERAVNALSVVADKAETFAARLKDCVDFSNADKITVGDVLDASVLAKNMRAVNVLDSIGGGEIEALGRLVAACDTLGKLDSGNIVLYGEADDPRFGEVAKCKELYGMKLSDVALVADNAALFSADGVKNSDSFIEHAEKLLALSDKEAELTRDILFVFDKIDNATGIERLCASVQKYADGGKVGFFDLKAKSAFKKLYGYCSRKNLSRAELACAAAKVTALVALRGEKTALSRLISYAVGRSALSETESASVIAAVRYGKDIGVSKLALSCVKMRTTVAECKKLAALPAEFRIGELAAAAEKARARNALGKFTRALYDRAGVSVGDDEYVSALCVSAAARLTSSREFENNAAGVKEFAEAVSRSAVAPAADEVVRTLEAFGAEYFENAYTAHPRALDCARIHVLSTLARDRSALGAALGYDGIKRENKYGVGAFLDALEDSGRVPDEYCDIFDKTYAALAAEHKLTVMGKKRNTLCGEAELAFKKLDDAEVEIRECNAIRTENLCMARIDPNDPDFDFLSADRGVKSSLRLLFRNHADALSKLKRCFILSPSSASVLLRGDIYENFDVLVMDEASQTEPVDMLPVLFRAKQCVLVGDEFQMPPLSHFKTKNRKRIYDGDSLLTLDTDISALSLALGNTAFDAEELVCHYRSNTECLIAFSQREFYPFMRTFPAALPSSPDLGFTDVYVRDGACEDGVNKAEAAAVAEALKRHFDAYLDEKSGTLGMSVGVVTFGEAQLKYVKELVRNDAALYSRMETALGAFDDVKDKLVFFRTIESVQGQETDHLILSLTYGKDKNGNVKLAFGELNRDDAGKNIFNVAVTRAKNKVTVIHSVRPSQLDGNPRIAFIRDYLAAAERFAAADGRGGFVTTEARRGANFLASVADFIVSCGVDRDRVVVNYGVTDGSVRIPIAVLDKTLSRAEFGVWCELPTLKEYDYIDYNVRYTKTLERRGWVLHRLMIHDYFDNADAARGKLADAVRKHVTL